jgi:hypothetical protein
MKKGELAINWIVVAALALFMLLILMFIFGTQVGDFAEKYMSFGNQIDEARKGESCASFLDGRDCYTKQCTDLNDKADTPATEQSGFRYRAAPSPPAGAWKDCPAAGNADRKFCCIRATV